MLTGKDQPLVGVAPLPWAGVLDFRVGGGNLSTGVHLSLLLDCRCSLTAASCSRLCGFPP